MGFRPYVLQSVPTGLDLGHERASPVIPQTALMFRALLMTSPNFAVVRLITSSNQAFATISSILHMAQIQT